ncbi:MAG: UDP-glucuronosyltransferase [Nitrososphaeraceae archaeon]|nr:UDP-glucuronosyltransferase [Nitrososphaeraceae archaeon]MBV9668293.1 UDP-glucuronosyltransferase [Nitrososphaeraceae archaeon]
MTLFFTSPIGLGHATRDIAIADKLKPVFNEILFITGAGAFTLISKRGYSVLDLYKPVNFDTELGKLQHHLRWMIRYLSYYRKCKRIAQSLLAKNSGLMISDEDFASLAIAEKLNRKCILITDIVETHFTRRFGSIVERRTNKNMRKIIDKCTSVIIPCYGDNKDNFVYVGPIVREVRDDRVTLRKRFGFNKKTIVLSTGGTDAGKYLIDKSIEAYRKLRKKMDIDLVIVPGPILELADAPDFRNIGFVDNLHEYIYASDLVISLAGRSTMDESIAYGIPGIFIPIKNHFEQEECAKRLGYNYGDILRIDTLIEEKLSSEGNIMGNNNGAEKAAKLILKLL